MNTSVAQVAGTAGEGLLEEVVAYLSRLTGETLSADQAFRLRSIHRAAFASWARKQNISLRHDCMNAGSPYTIREMLGEAAPALSAVKPVPAEVVTHHVSASSFNSIGVDIEEVENLPLVADYREDPFFQDHFTNAEIAYCILQRDPRASFCGIWAAKEAILKAGLIPSSTLRLRDFEIGRDALGRPWFPGCSLSMSHTAKTAVAVCAVTASAAPAAYPVDAPKAAGVPSDITEVSPTRKKWPWSRQG